MGRTDQGLVIEWDVGVSGVAGARSEDGVGVLGVPAQVGRQDPLPTRPVNPVGVGDRRVFGAILGIGPRLVAVLDGSQAELSEIRLALRRLSRLPRGHDGRQQQTGEGDNDGDHDEHLDQGEARPRDAAGWPAGRC